MTINRSGDVFLWFYSVIVGIVAGIKSIFLEFDEDGLNALNRKR